ncbi:hypothetical protein C8J56DRAFT_1045770 [Mycena floridula]|nr:hypothetical protein C8J56DRAFT_1045770 [Mycena floridula]
MAANHPPPAFPQKKFHLFRSMEDHLTPRLTTTDDTIPGQIAAEACLMVTTLFSHPYMRNLVAQSLKDMDPLSEETFPIDTEDMEKTIDSLTQLPQIDFVENISFEACVVRTADHAAGNPFLTTAVKIQVKAERWFSLATLAETKGIGKSHRRYKVGFKFLVIVLAREMMHLVQERAFGKAWQKITPPCICSQNYPNNVLYNGDVPIDLTNSLPVKGQEHCVPTTPTKLQVHKGESGYWLEEQLTDGCCIEAMLLENISNFRSWIVPNNFGRLEEVVNLIAKRKSSGGYVTWVLDSSHQDDHDRLLDCFVTTSTADEMVAGIKAMQEYIHNKAPVFHPIKAKALSKETMHDEEFQPDVFDAADIVDLKTGPSTRILVEGPVNIIICWRAIILMGPG